MERFWRNLVKLYISHTLPLFPTRMVKVTFTFSDLTIIWTLIVVGTVLWALDESCNIYVRPDASDDSQWDQLDQVQFGNFIRDLRDRGRSIVLEWTRRLIHMVCNNAGVWAVDDHGHIYFRHGHAGTRRSYDLDDMSVLPAAWISIPGAPKKNRSFTQIFCGPADWMVRSISLRILIIFSSFDRSTPRIINKLSMLGVASLPTIALEHRGNRLTVRGGESDRPATMNFSDHLDCSALELAISEHSLWLLTSCGQIQCRENISLENPIGTRSTTLPGVFLSLTGMCCQATFSRPIKDLFSLSSSLVSADDKQVWALDSNRNLLKLDRLTILLEK